MKKTKTVHANNDGRIKFRKLADIYRRKIISGEIPVGSMLPCEREMQKTFKMSRITVRNAVEMLTNEGLIEKRQGRGGGAVVISQTSKEEKMRHGLSFGTFFSIHSFGYRNDILEVMEGIIRELNIWESNLHPFPFVPDIDQTEFVKSVVERKLIDGVFLWPLSEYTEEVIHYLEKKKFPFLFMTTDREETNERELLMARNSPTVSLGETATAKNLVKRAVAQGCKKLIISGFQGKDVDQTYAFFSKIAENENCQIAKSEAMDPPFASAVELLKTHRRKDGDMILISDNQFLPYFDAAVDHLKTAMPDDVSVVVYPHNRHTDERVFQRYTTLDRPYLEMGTDAAKMMTRLLDLKGRGESCLTGENKIAPCRIIDRGTSAI